MKKLAKAVGADITGEQSLGKYTGPRTAPTRDEIAQLAFTFYESRGWQERSRHRRLGPCRPGTPAALRLAARRQQYTRREEVASIKGKANL
jgi:hypothetical protein